MLLIAISAAASAWLVTRKAPQHRPLAWALTVCAALDAVRLLGPPARVDMALCCLTPLVSMVAYVIVFGGRVGLVGLLQFMAVIGIWCGSGGGRAWSWILPSVYALALWFSGWQIAWHIREREPWAISQRVALVLLAGDALAVASLCAREWISDQAGVVLALVTVYQLIWYRRWTADERLQEVRADAGSNHDDTG